MSKERRLGRGLEALLGRRPKPEPDETPTPQPRQSPAAPAAPAPGPTRLDMSRSLGLHEGDVHVIRNAGGVVTGDAIRSLAISQHLLGTEEIMLIHHTRCGMQFFSDEEFGDRMEEATGQRPRWSSGGFEDLDGDVRQSIARLRDSPFIRHKHAIRGFVYEVESGLLREVDGAGPGDEERPLAS